MDALALGGLFAGVCFALRHRAARKAPPKSSSSAEVDRFFKMAPRPTHYDEAQQELERFVRDHHDLRIVVVTSGGTIVPLERNTVRYIDNFSTGTRGAMSVEEFIRLGYAVVFLHREGSKMPLIGALSDFAERVLTRSDIEQRGRTAMIEVTDTRLMRAVMDYHEAYTAGRLLCIPFRSVSDYLHLLRLVCASVAPHRERAMLYLCAAVSDFYIPYEDMPEHKIQSSDGTLRLHLLQVPKMLGKAHEEWAPDAFCVSFKLETDRDILLAKARESIQRYHVHCVVANMLHTRHEEVLLVQSENPRVVPKPVQLPSSTGRIRLGRSDDRGEGSVATPTLPVSNDEWENARAPLERRIVDTLVKLHNDFVSDMFRTRLSSDDE